MEYIIIGLLVVLVILVVLSLSKNINESNITERLGKLETNTIKELGSFKNDINTSLNTNFNTLNDKIEDRLIKINEKVNERLDINFERTNKTFNSVIERLAKIDEAQKKIDSLSNDIVSLQSVLTDKKTRGIFGEVNLKHILTSIFGESSNIYKMQYTFENGTIADAVLFAPEPLGTIAIDSKFPLENYRILVDKKKTEQERNIAEKQFKLDVKKHIDAISSKYIIHGITSDQAIMFLPAEAIFAELNAYHSEIIEYAYSKKIWIASPTTLISTLTTIQLVIRNIEKDKYTTIIHQELNKLSLEFARYKERWGKLSRSIETVSKDVNEVNISTEKITKRFDAINNYNGEKKEIEEKENV